MSKELEAWLDNMVVFSMYCRPVARERWIFDLENFIKREKLYGPEMFSIKKDCYALAAEFILMIHEKKSWEEIKAVFKRKVGSAMYKSIVCDIMLQYSEYETEFVEQVIDLEEANWYADLVHKYDDRKIYLQMQKSESAELG